MTPHPFWMVKGEGPATAIHMSRRDAEIEADRLARKMPGMRFYVLQAVACHVKVEVQRIDMTDMAEAMDADATIPF